MNTSINYPGGSHSVTPPYCKWFGPAPAEGLARTAPAPLPFNEVHEKGTHSVGPPSTPADGYSNYGSFTIPEGADGETLYGTCSLFLGVDDWGSLEVRNSSGQIVAQVDLKENSRDVGDQGGHKYHTSTGGAQLPSGSYSWEVNQRNIDYQPSSGNISICNYSIDVVPTEPGGREKPEPCPCEGDSCNNDGGSPSGFYARSSGSSGAGGFSSAGCSVNAESTAMLMYWSCNFGAFRGLGSIPSGRVELREEESVAGLQSRASLAYSHPLASYLDVPEGGVAADSRFDLVQGDRIIAMRCDSNGVDVRPVGVDTQGGGIAALVTKDGQSCLQWTVTDGGIYLFSSLTGELVSYTTPDKREITNASSYLDVKRAQDGSLLQIWNLWDGLLNVEAVTTAGYMIALYTPGQITGTDEAGLYTVTGDPFKTFLLALFEDENRFTITEQTPGSQPYAVAWWKNGQAWNMSRGTGEETLLTARTRTELEPSVWQLVTERSRNGAAASRVCEVYQTTDIGTLLLTRVNGYGGAAAQTTQYAYDQCGRLKTETAPDGSRIHCAYDLYGRLLSRDEPWAESGRRITRYTYGTVTTTENIAQLVQWSSEMNDEELGLVYYNYRHYNPQDGRWINRDPIAEEGGWNLYGFVRNNGGAIWDELGLVPNEQDPIFIFPYVDENTGYGQMTYASEEEIKKFYDAVNDLSQKTVDDKKCYKLYVVKNRSATLKDAENKKCDIKLIIGHGIKIDGKDFVKLKDGLICINDLNKDGKICKGFGCCIGENKTTIPHTVAIQQLTAEVNSLLNSEDCPCKNVCILSGPINQ